jgi:hypothetical protein
MKERDLASRGEKDLPELALGEERTQYRLVTDNGQLSFEFGEGLTDGFERDLGTEVATHRI